MPKIAYFAEKFPSLTQTFVYREVLKLRQLGLSPKLYSIWPSDPSGLSAESKSLVNDTFYIFPISLSSLFSIHLSYFFKKPIKYIKVLLYILFQPEEPLINRFRSLRHFIYGIKAIRQFEVDAIDHIHAHFGWSASSIALMANQLLGTPFSITLHAHGIFIDRLLLKAKLVKSKAVVTISKFNKSYLCNLFPDVLLEDKIKIIHCGIDAALFKDSYLKEKSTSNFVIVGIGQLDPRKGFHILIEACKILADRNEQFLCYIIGDGPEREKLDNLISRFGLGEQVFLNGKILQEELRLFLKSVDVSVLPCVWDKSGDLDGIPVALMETMSMGIPSVSTNISGIPELIEHKKSGLLCENSDCDELADILQRLKHDYNLCVNLGKEGRKKILKDFNIDNSSQKLYDLFNLPK